MTLPFNDVPKCEQTLILRIERADDTGIYSDVNVHDASSWRRCEIKVVELFIRNKVWDSQYMYNKIL